MVCHGIDCGIELTNGPGKFSIVTNIGGADEESEYTRLAKKWDRWGKIGKAAARKRQTLISINVNGGYGGDSPSNKQGFLQSIPLYASSHYHGPLQSYQNPRDNHVLHTTAIHATDRAVLH